MKHLTKVLKTLADQNRLRILKLLEKKKLCVCELSSILGITQPSISRHLKKLKSVGLINEEQEGFWTNYFLSIPDDVYGKVLLNFVQGWLNEDSLIKKDIEKSMQVNRVKLCCKK